MIEAINYYLKFGDANYSAVFFIALIGYFFVKIATYLARAIVYKRKGDKTDILILGKAAGFLILILIIYVFSIGAFLGYINTHSSFEAVNRSNLALMKLDKMLFGSYIPFDFQTPQSSLSKIFNLFPGALIKTYTSLGAVMGLIFILALALRPKIFWMMMGSFFISFAISLPFWHFFPALSPLEGYIDNVSRATFSAPIEAVIGNYAPNQELQNFFTSIRELRKETSQNFLAVTTMPSMHIAWALIILFFGSKLSRYFLFILVPYFFLTMIGTIYTMQHYAVDVLAGIIVGAAAIFIAKRFLNGSPPKVFSDLSLLIQKDIITIRNALISVKL